MAQVKTAVRLVKVTDNKFCLAGFVQDPASLLTVVKPQDSKPPIYVFPHPIHSDTWCAARKGEIGKNVRSVTAGSPRRAFAYAVKTFW